MSRVEKVTVYTNNYKIVLKTVDGSYTKQGPLTPRQADRTILHSDDYTITIKQDGTVVKVPTIVNSSLQATAIGVKAAPKQPTVKATNPLPPTPPPIPPPTPPPVQGISIYPGDSFADKVRAYPAGTVFVVRAGLHVGQQTNPKDDMKFVGEPGAVLDGQGKEFAFAGVKGGTGGKRVGISLLEILGYAPAKQSAVIRPFGYAYDWILEDLNLHDCANIGVGVDQGWFVRRCKIHHMGTMGLGGGGNAVIEDSEIYANNTTKADSHWEAGGMKFVYSNGLRVQRCFIHNNDGPGVWFDGHNADSYYLNNRIWDNRGPGIDHEICGSALIEGNDCQRNGQDPGWADDYDLGGSGIVVSNSVGVIVRNNTCLDNQGGIGVGNGNRTLDGKPIHLENVEIYGNRIRYTARKSGMAWDVPIPRLDTVKFHDNIYEIDPNRVGFRVGSTNMNFATWQSRWSGEVLAS